LSNELYNSAPAIPPAQPAEYSEARPSREARLVVFVDGCFWHACPKHSTTPATNRPFWKKKLAANQFRDRQVNRTLRKNGWRVIRIWEHDLAKRRNVCVGRIKATLDPA